VSAGLLSGRFTIRGKHVFRRSPSCLRARLGIAADRLAFPPANLATLAEKDFARHAMDVRTANALLVDDDDASYKATQRRLEDDGYSVQVARDGVDGLARAKRSAPDVIFVHLIGGRQSNVAFIQALRSDDACRHVPVTILSGRPEPAPRPNQLRPVRRERW
jgi:CheY-like chemotaxis protein